MKQGTYTRVYAIPPLKIAREAISCTHSRILLARARPKFPRKVSANGTNNLYSSSRGHSSCPLRSKIEINPAKILRIYLNYHFYLYIYYSFRYIELYISRQNYCIWLALGTKLQLFFTYRDLKKKQGVIISLIISVACRRKRERCRAE